MNGSALVKGLIAASFLIWVDCASSGEQDTREGRDQAWYDIDYVGDGIVGHRLDIYRPETGSGPFPVVVYIYGSAWFGNDQKKQVGTDLGPILLQAGFAVASINHRSSGDAAFPAQIHDVKAAVRYIRANARTYDLDPDRIGVTGASSGGHLAALLGTSGGVGEYTVGEVTMDIEGDLGDYTGTSSRVQAVCDWFGPTDFLVMNQCGSDLDHDASGSPESALIGGPIQDHSDRCALANPITYIDAGEPPFRIFHGSADPLVPLCQSDALHQSLEAVGTPSAYTVIEGGGHGPAGVVGREHLDVMIDFFTATLRTRFPTSVQPGSWGQVKIAR